MSNSLKRLMFRIIAVVLTVMIMFTTNIAMIISVTAETSEQLNSDKRNGFRTVIFLTKNTSENIQLYWWDTTSIEKTGFKTGQRKLSKKDDGYFLWEFSVPSNATNGKFNIGGNLTETSVITEDLEIKSDLSNLIYYKKGKGNAFINFNNTSLKSDSKQEDLHLQKEENRVIISYDSLKEKFAGTLSSLTSCYHFYDNKAEIASISEGDTLSYYATITGKHDITVAAEDVFGNLYDQKHYCDIFCRTERENFTFSVNEMKVIYGNSCEIQKLNGMFEDIVYSSSDENVVKINGTALNILKTGSVKIKATAPQTDEYNEQTTEYILNIENGNGDNQIYFANETINMKYLDTFENPIIYDKSIHKNAIVTYQSSYPSAVVVDDSGKITANKAVAEPVTITAYVKNLENYSDTEKSYVVNVSNAGIEASVQNDVKVVDYADNLEIALNKLISITKVKTMQKYDLSYSIVSETTLAGGEMKNKASVDSTGIFKAKRSGIFGVKVTVIPVNKNYEEKELTLTIKVNRGQRSIPKIAPKSYIVGCSYLLDIPVDENAQVTYKINEKSAEGKVSLEDNKITVKQPIKAFPVLATIALDTKYRECNVYFEVNADYYQPEDTDLFTISGTYAGDNSEEHKFTKNSITLKAKTGYQVALYDSEIKDVTEYQFRNSITFKNNVKNPEIVFKVIDKKSSLYGAVTNVMSTDILLDKTAPTGQIKISQVESVFKKLLTTITFGLFVPECRFYIEAEDNKSEIFESGNVEIKYFVQRFENKQKQTLMTFEELSEYESWKDYTDNFVLTENENIVIYARLTDKFGNYSFISSKGIVIDNSKPIVKISYNNNKSSDDGYYKSGRTATFTVYDDNFKGTADMISISAENGGQQIDVPISWKNEGSLWTCVIKFKDNGKYHIDFTDKFKDKAGNECNVIEDYGTKDVYDFVIDKVTPEVLLSYDNNNGKGIYYNNSRTAKIVVSDNNFKGTADMIEISTVDKTGEVKLPEIEWIDNICEISFEEDAHYEMKFTDTFRDRAGNKCKVTPEENTENAYNFVIDQTSPEILLSYDNNDFGEAGYYKDFRKATITVEDDNFTGTVDMVKVVAKDSEKQSFAIENVIWNNNEGTVVFDKEGSYELEITDTFRDKAGNIANITIADGTKDPYKFTIDKTVPKVMISYDNNTPSTGRYYTDFRTATLTVEDVNFTPNETMTEVIATDVDGKAIQKDGKNLEIKTEWNNNVATIYYNEEANYCLKILDTFKDKAGNKAVVNIADGTNDPYEFVIDKTKPNVIVKYTDNKETLTDVLEKFLSFAIGDIVYFQDTVKVEISAKDTVSGIDKITYSAPVSTDKNEAGLEAVLENSVINGKISRDFKVEFDIPAEYKGKVMAKVSDKANNLTDIDEDTIAVSKKKPEITLEILNPDDAVKHDSVMYFNTNIKVGITVEDIFFDVDLKGNEEYLTIRETTDGKNTQNIILNDVWRRVSEDTNRYYNEFELSDEGNKKLEVSYTNYSGNSADNSIIEDIVIDKTAPKVTVSYDNNDVRNEKFYNNNRILKLKVKDRNFVGSQNMVSITAKDVNGNALAVPTVDWESDTGTITFANDGEYTFETTNTLEDKAGNKAIIDIDGGTKNKFSDEFIIDKTAPKVTMSYNNNYSSVGGYYYNTPRTLTLNVEEDYFITDGSISITAKDMEENILSSPEIIWSEKTTDSIRTATVKFTEDAIYKLSFAIHDQAENVFEDFTDKDKQKNITEFVVDTTSPTGLNINYTDKEGSITGTLEKFVEFVTGGIGIVYFKDTVTVTISAKDITSGIDRIEYSAVVNTDKNESGLRGIETVKVSNSDDKSAELSTKFDISPEYKGNVKATVYNKAGLNTTTIEDKIAVSIKEPKITLGILNIADAVTHDGISYFNEDVKIRLKVEDVFFNASKVVIKENNKRIYPSSSWSRKNGTNEYYCDVVLTTEGVKTLKVDYTNNSGVDAVSKSLKDFVIDKTAPEVTVSYNNNQSYVGGYYYQAQRTATIKVKDANFKPTDKMINLSAKDVSGKNLEIPKVSWNRNGEECTIIFSDNAYYQMKFTKDFVDKAGNEIKVTVAKDTKDVYEFAVDNVNPNIKVEIYQGIYRLNTVTNEQSGTGKVIYSNKAVEIVVTADDNMTLLENLDIKYSIEASVDSVKDKTYTAPITLEPDRKFKITAVVTDKSGRKVECTSDNIVLDKTAPDIDGIPPEVQFDVSKNNPKIDRNGNTLYNSNVILDFSVIDPIINNSCSGLDISTLKYTILKDGQITQSGNLSGTTENYDGRPRVLTGSITVDANLNNSNNVTVVVDAKDNSENSVEESTNLSIDITNPSIAVSYSNNKSDNENQKYFNATRVAEIKITERNFDENDVIIKAKKDNSEYNPQLVWQHSGNAYTDSYVHTAQIIYSQDGDYQFDITYTDEASNKANKTDYGNSQAPNDFTIDRTAPAITLSYDNNSVKNGNYYKAKRVATITVHEHNFDAKRFKYECSAVDNGKSIAAPVMSGWSSSGDIHTATVRFTQDARFTMNMSFIDMAGNGANSVPKQEFYVDTKSPKISMSGVTYKSANNNEGNIGFVLSAVDENVNRSSFKVKLNRVDIKGMGDDFTSYGKKDDTDNGISYSINNVKDDGIYTVTCEISDMAGNVTTIVNINDDDKKEHKEEEVIFSVNRMGSTFMLDDSTKKLVSDKYIKQVEEDIIITEINPDTVNKYAVILTKNEEEPKVLSYETNYYRSIKEDEKHWNTYEYKINKSNFEDEGSYSLAITTSDIASNTSYSETKNPDYSKEPVAKVDFVVDRTIPQVIVNNIQDGGHYNMESKTVDIIANDDNILQGLTITLNDKVVKEYNEEQLAEVQGRLSLNINSSKSLQNLKIVAVDAAHNSTEDSDSTSVNITNILITTNVWIQFINNPALVVTAVSVIALSIATTVFFIVRKKRKNR